MPELPNTSPEQRPTPSLPPSTQSSAPTIADLKRQLADAEAALAAKAAAPRPFGELRPMIGLKQIMKLTGKSHNAIMDGAGKGTFPKPVKTGPRSIRWFVDEIVLWQELAAAEREVKRLLAELERAQREASRAAERERAIRRQR